MKKEMITCRCLFPGLYIVYENNWCVLSPQSKGLYTWNQKYMSVRWVSIAERKWYTFFYSNEKMITYRLFPEFMHYVYENNWCVASPQCKGLYAWKQNQRYYCQSSTRKHCTENDMTELEDATLIKWHRSRFEQLSSA